MKPSISIITQFYPPDYAATGQFVHDLACALVKEGYSINVFTGMPSYAFKQRDVDRQEYRNGVLVNRTGSTEVMPRRIRGKLISSLLFWVRCAIKFRTKVARGSHLIITTAPPFLGLIGWFYNKLCGHTYTCLIYDIYPEVAVRLNVVRRDEWIVKIWEAINLRVWRRANSLVVLSEPMKQLLIQRHRELADKIHVIHSWADNEFIKPLAKERNWFIQEHGLTNAFIVLYSGNLGRCHDEITLMQAARLLCDRPQIKFVFIGGGVGSHRIQAAIDAGELPNTIKLPYQDHEVLPYSLTACDLSLVSLKANVEGVVAPSKLYGTLATGRPVAAICPPDSYIRQIIEQGNCGQCFSNGDAQGLADYIWMLSQNHSLQDYLGKNARSYFEQNFTLEHAIPLYLKAIGLPQARPANKSRLKRGGVDEMPTQPTLID
ncbi:glycosyltransferase family 4 protein [Tumidithrix elongata RA019]|uniref:Glycosyltransferase family 4 protein n=1 Tax=Tumidithrix elongata BACA0141 TaxID=2716417 RepID=A0AAW9Q769_9CYAN|nr:glycosyltransferase family 4 protein [Tumidithrix elongata RA019]